VLAAFESRAGSVGLAHGTRAFSKLPRTQRERVLMRWATSPLARQRTFFQTVKRLASFFAYADPGPDGVNPRWTEIRYEPVVNETIRDSLIVAQAIVPSATTSLDAEVVVVGSGAGGCLIAARLAEVGHDVLVIEAGPYVSEPQMPTDELAAFDRLYLDHGMTSTSDAGLAILAGSALGGGTLVNWTTSIEPPAEVRAQWATDFGLTDFDGAETDADLARLRAELDFAAPPSIGPKDQAIIDGANALGWEGAPTQRDADNCGDCGSCGFGCRRGTKLSGQQRYLADAVRHGARLMVDARIERVTFAGNQVSGVSGFSGGRSFDVRAKCVVVAAGALRTPVLLMASGIEHDQLGRNLHLHPTAVVAGRMSAPVNMWRGTLQAARSLEYIRDGIVIESAPGHPGLIALAFPWESAEQQAQMMREAHLFVPFIGICRDTDGGRIELTRAGHARIDYRISGRDIKTARKALVAMAKLARASGADRVLALSTPARWQEIGPTEDSAWDRYLDGLGRLDFAPNRATLFSAHQMGTARAGVDRRTSPADPHGRVRRDAGGSLVKGLYVGDASLFPTAVGVNPMITVMALAARVARAVDSDLRQRSS
jgi:choline dehydrogenase-like flavoprotein